MVKSICQILRNYWENSLCNRKGNSKKKTGRFYHNQILTHFELLFRINLTM